MSVKFVITDVGLARAAQANQKGITLTIAKFAIGSEYGYTPSTSDLSLHGNILYRDTPTTYKYVGNETLQITCNVADTVGPFAWGEIGLYLDSGELFALAALPALQQKYSSIESDVASSLTLACYLTLSYRGVSITIDYGENPLSIVEILDVYKWSDVKLPKDIQEGISQVIVHELSPMGNSSLLIKTNSDRWSILTSDYTAAYRNAVPCNSSKTYLEFNLAQNNIPTTAASTIASDYILAFADGTYASIAYASLASNNTVIRFYYTDALTTARELDSQTTIYRVSTNIKYNTPIIDINQGTTGTLPYSRLSGVPVASDLGAVPIGGILFWPLAAIPKNYILANGANNLSRTTYAELYNVYGTRYGSGTGSNQFGVPNLQDRYIMGAGSRANVGAYLSDALPNATGQFGADDFMIRSQGASGNPSLVSGVFYKKADYAYDASSEGKGNGGLIGFDLSRSNSIFGAASYVRPATFVGNWIIRYK